MNEKIDKSKLTIPIYLNTKIVFDMLATIEDGFSEVKNIQTSKSKNREEDTEANIGMSNLFALFSVGLKGNLKSGNSSDQTIMEEKTHTTVSLFQKLKADLDTAKLINRNIDTYEIGDFVEIQGNLKTNPLIEMLSALKELMALQFSEVMKDKPVSYYAFEVLYWTGIREGELLALERGDFNIPDRKLTINKSYQHLQGKDYITSPKTEKSNRVIELPEFLCREMEDYFGMLYKCDEHTRLFTFSKSYLHHEMDRGAKAAGVKRIRIHDLRHPYVKPTTKKFITFFEVFRAAS